MLVVDVCKISTTKIEIFDEVTSIVQVWIRKYG
jgi:hypothetical protein